MEKIILASKSPRRKQLLEWAEIPFEIMVSEAEESFPDGLRVEEAAVFIARNKAWAVKRSLNDERKIILAADTIVVLDNKVIGKPQERNEAIEMLHHFQGATRGDHGCGHFKR